MRHTALALTLLSVGSIQACGSCREQAASPETRQLQAKAEVRRFFEALAASDCPTMRGLLPTMKTEHDCEEFVDEAVAQGLGLARIDGVTSDGRAPNSYIVRSQLTVGDQTKEVMIRATWSADGWSLVL